MRNPGSDFENPGSDFQNWASEVAGLFAEAWHPKSLKSSKPGPKSEFLQDFLRSGLGWSQLAAAAVSACFCMIVLLRAGLGWSRLVSAGLGWSRLVSAGLGVVSAGIFPGKVVVDRVLL